MKFKSLLAGFTLLAASAGAFAQFTIVPAQPEEFDDVVVRMTVDSCVYDIDRIGVRKSGDTFVVGVGVRNCLVPGPLRVIDVRIGSLPIGSYRVVVERVMGDLIETPPPFSTTFDVRPRPTLAIFPPPKKPLNDYSGNWVTQTELGWGLSIQHSPTQVLFAQLFVYTPAGAPTWFTLQGGQWTSATRWEGQIFGSTGPGFAAPLFDPRQVVTASVGAASLEFEQSPGTEGFATLTYTVGGTTITKRIRRFLF